MTPVRIFVAAASVLFAEHLALDALDLSLQDGDRIGLVGDNGAGKSTLLRLIAGDIAPTAGRIETDGTTAYTSQTSSTTATITVSDLIDSALADARRIESSMRDYERRMSEASEDELPRLIEAYARTVDAYDAIDGYHLADRVAAALDSLGVAHIDRRRRIGEISGGEQHRVALAAALSARADILLLDEPTNDLDDRAVAWVEQRIAETRGIVVAASHDRAFLRSLTTSVIELEDGKAKRYGNGYDGYLSTKAAERERMGRDRRMWESELERHAQLIERNAASIAALPRTLDLPGFGHGAFRGRAPGHGSVSRIRTAKAALAHLRENEPPRAPEELSFQAPAVSVMTENHVAISLQAVSVHGRLGPVTVEASPGDRVLITGPNGAGKSTLLAVIAGRVGADGESSVSGRIAELHQRMEPYSTDDVLRAYGRGRPEHDDDLRRELVATGLLTREQTFMPPSRLSEGQRRRLELARAVAMPSDILLLDEPTNHLAPEVIEQMEQAITAYPGIVVLVTHDRQLRASFPTTHRIHLEPARVLQG